MLLLRAILFAVIFTVVGAVLFGLLAPLLLHDQGVDFKKLGEASAPVILLVCGGTGFLFGLYYRKKP